GPCWSRRPCWLRRLCWSRRLGWLRSKMPRRERAGRGRRGKRGAVLSAGLPAADSTAPTPTLSRLHAAGAPSARGLLLTLLGVFVLPGDGTAWTSAVIAAFTRLGIEGKATRQALMRTAAAGGLRSREGGPPCSLAPDRRRTVLAH